MAVKKLTIQVAMAQLSRPRTFSPRHQETVLWPRSVEFTAQWYFLVSILINCHPVEVVGVVTRQNYKWVKTLVSSLSWFCMG